MGPCAPKSCKDYLQSSLRAGWLVSRKMFTSQGNSHCYLLFCLWDGLSENSSHMLIYLNAWSCTSVAVAPARLWKHHADSAKATPLLKRHDVLLCLHHNPQDYCLYHTLTHTDPGSLVNDLWPLASHVPTSLVLQLRLDL